MRGSATIIIKCLPNMKYEGEQAYGVLRNPDLIIGIHCRAVDVSMDSL